MVAHTSIKSVEFFNEAELEENINKLPDCVALQFLGIYLTLVRRLCLELNNQQTLIIFDLLIKRFSDSLFVESITHTREMFGIKAGLIEKPVDNGVVGIAVKN